MKAKTTRRPQAKAQVLKSEPVDTEIIDLTLEEDEANLPSNDGMYSGDMFNTDPMARVVSANRRAHRNSGHALDYTHEPASSASTSSLDVDDDEEQDMDPSLETILRDILPESLAAFAASTMNNTPQTTTRLQTNHPVTPLHPQNNEGRPTRRLSNRFHQQTPSSASAVRGHGGSEPLTPEKWAELKEVLKRKGREQIRFWEAILRMLD